MEAAIAPVVLISLIFLVLGMGVWVFLGLVMVALLSLHFVMDFSFARIGSITSTIFASKMVSWELAAIPLFILMGDIIVRTDMSRRLFQGISPFARLLPGGLLHTNVLGCTMFAAVCGSSPATAATIGKITIPELKARGYDHQLSSGSLAGAGTFGLLIPPSISLVIYGISANVSIAKLFMAGIVPGIVLAIMYSAYIAIRCKMNPALAPSEGARPTLREFAQGIWILAPMILLMGFVLGTIYTGIATPSEAAAMGVMGSILITAASRQFSLRLFLDALRSALRVSAMITILIASSAVLSAAIAYMHVPQTISDMFVQMNLQPWMLIAVLLVFYIILGMFIDGISIIVMTLPIAFPLIVNAGFDPIWFGVFLVLVIEMSAITPPVGLNLFVLQGLTGDSFTRTIRAAFPFFLLLVLGAIIMSVFPQIILFLPELMSR
ncbi:TRAP transporter large permease [Ketogulonicigenium vulgare]|uniref:TRAP transporter large permease protein n=1 Tax=Ketogulonicigenium vulgare (strain WSH-001) TaxID=759362 RepID=F9Y572_KETVW|nr:TRAP transporter large permease subunit [Ketogulonicigenium vulgare]ADO43605.1 TRAP dicarboxylate transporter, DctM subunit [Ketogulonicigenium vulgare Y25]AEM41877.1 TRAP-type C4-dicarboxylate transport system, large permease component [Ketogulonicigenium vulgare WSH-001]ALJ81985.1 C4-dicarboxylate ABC transporter permease [Ketogulonicigenium vulgare]ANW34622.1 C4-dicarboxylate ABC transporter permease [Ketogulonicigenium vulgare]AOZ55638.1 TRAP dicarboxylate transporter DctM subunit [Keto